MNEMTAFDSSGTDKKEKEGEEKEEGKSLWCGRSVQGVGREQDTEVEEDASKAWGTDAGCHHDQCDSDESQTNLCVRGCRLFRVTSDYSDE